MGFQVLVPLERLERVRTVHRDGDDFGAGRAVFLRCTRDVLKLLGAKRAEGERVEHQDDILATKGGELELLELVVPCGEIGRFRTNFDRHMSPRLNGNWLRARKLARGEVFALEVSSKIT